MLPSEEGKEKRNIQTFKMWLLSGLRRGSTLICLRSTPGYNLTPHPDSLMIQRLALSGPTYSSWTSATPRTCWPRRTSECLDRRQMDTGESRQREFAQAHQSSLVRWHYTSHKKYLSEYHKIPSGFLHRLSIVHNSCNFSGADISIVVRDALMQPVRKVRNWLKLVIIDPILLSVPRFKLRHISWQSLGRTGTTLIKLYTTSSPLAGKKFKVLTQHSQFNLWQIYENLFQPWDKGSEGDDLDGSARRKASWTKGSKSSSKALMLFFVKNFFGLFPLVMMPFRWIWPTCWGLWQPKSQQVSLISSYPYMSHL